MSSKVTTSPPNLRGLSSAIVTLTSGFSRPPARPPPLWLPHLAGWTPPEPCARPPSVDVEPPIAFSWCPTRTTAAQCFPASEKQVSHVWAVSRTYPIQLNCSDSRPRARWYQLRGLSLVGSECVCPQCNTSLVVTRGSAKPSASISQEAPLKSSQETQTKQKKWNSRHSKFSSRQMPNGTSTAAQVPV